jgi:hypothetical protein
VSWCYFEGRFTVRASSSCWGLGWPRLRGLSASPRRCLMATTSSSAALVPVTPVVSNTERLALAGFLAGYRPRSTRMPPALWPPTSLAPPGRPRGLPRTFRLAGYQPGGSPAVTTYLPLANRRSARLWEVLVLRALACSIGRSVSRKGSGHWLRQVCVSSGLVDYRSGAGVRLSCLSWRRVSWTRRAAGAAMRW